MMIKRAIHNDINRVINYIGKDYSKCLYLYLNLKKYGLDNKNICLYIDEENELISAVYLLYYDCLHFYSSTENKYNINKIMSTINILQPHTIFASKFIAIKLNDLGLGKKYITEYMNLVTTNEILRKVNLSEIRNAGIEDAHDIATFLIKDNSYSSIYTVDILEKQLYDRLKDNYSRIHFIKKNNEIVTTFSTYAEMDNICILGGLLTEKEYRGKGYATKMLCSLWGDIVNENKIGFGFVVSDESINLHQKLGFRFLDEIAKMRLKIEVNL